ncbi:protein-export membrane protein SecF [Longimycelium tulufanense]|uniref:Protein-export membrane protein SecF n=1 Tax=Longimycelium tulufanense TaxID=907463 RepID=A0A8J3FYI4_9PSEU|nr:protein translocase subunit SecF [Longimycelium tulufanense]GGM72316.1 protein-export membrane protein SecF [Longimycelium tulufanense]
MATPQTPTSPQRQGFFFRLYSGTGGLNIVGKRKWWYLVIALMLALCIGSMVTKGFTPGMDFVGGTQIQMPAKGESGAIDLKRVKSVFRESTGRDATSAQRVGAGAGESVLIRSVTLTNQETAKVKADLFDAFKPLGTDGQPSQASISDSKVSSTWGGEISRKALIALGVFLVLVMIFLSVYFERWMAIAALAALVYDITVTAGIYSLVGFEVTPATVIGLLTILGYSLYDTVVVFDKVKENTRGLLGLTRRNYAETANLALNQTLMRSVNTSLTSLLPVLGLLIIGAGLLGVGTLKDLALVQAVGILTGTFSSIFLATPLLVDLKMRDPRFKQQAARVAARRAKAGDAAAAMAAAPTGTDDQALGTELRREKALAAAASVPARPGKGPESRRTRRPAGKAGRPTGKRGR